MLLKAPPLLVRAAAALLVISSGHAANVNWDGSESTDWFTGLNWDNTTGPIAGDVAYIASGTVDFDTESNENLRAIRLQGGTLNLLGGSFTATAQSSWDSHIDSTLNHSGTIAAINELEIGRSSGKTGFYALSGGSLKISRGLNGYSLYLGANKSSGNAGTGTLEITGGAFTTRSSVKLGDDSSSGTGTFAVLGSAIGEIGIAASNGDNDATWLQHSGSTLKVGIDLGGVRSIFLNDSATATSGTSATFENGSLLDVSYYGNGSKGGTWTVMEVENGDVIDNGLAFAPGVNTSVWSFNVDNSGANGLLTVTATGTPDTGNVFWTGLTDDGWNDATNWNRDPVEGDYVWVTFGTPELSADNSIAIRGLRSQGGTFTISGGQLNAAFQSSAESHINGTISQTGGTAIINELEIGNALNETGAYLLSGGQLNISRAREDNSLYLGGNRRGNDGGTGTLEISGGSFITRYGVKLGHATKPGTGNFAVLGSSATQIGIGTSNGSFDGYWNQHAGSTLKVGIDFGGVTPIFLDDSSSDTNGTYTTFENGSLLDVGYYDNGSGGGTWTVMEVEDGDITDNGLAFAPGVDTSTWSFNVDNSGPNGLLTITAAGDPTGIPIVVGNTPKQTMRYGMDYERLWYWTTSLNSAERDLVAKWSVVDNDIDFIRVAINAGYELTEGNYDLSAYTFRIIPMMQEMQEANPDIKFFASPRPLDEAVNNVAWQPYPQWITGSTGSSSNFNFNWQKCAEYLVRYIELMDSYGFEISYLDLTNEWNFLTPTHARDIAEYLEADLIPKGLTMPLIIAPSTWSYAQGRSWLAGVNTARRRDAIDISASHNTNKTGTAEDFVERSHDILGPEKEVWNTELHGWKSTSSANEALTFSFMLEAINAGFSGLTGWLAIGTTNQGHSYILNPNGTPVRNVKYFIFNKLTNTSHRGQALDIDTPAELSHTTALIKDNLLTVWAINQNPGGVPINIDLNGLLSTNQTITKTQWNTGLSVEGIATTSTSTDPTKVFALIPGESVCCIEIPLDPPSGPVTRFEAESHDGQSGTRLEDTSDSDGVQNVAYISNNDWIRYDDLTLAENTYARFRVARPTGVANSKIEVRLGSPTGALIGSADIPVTGDWQAWKTIEVPLTNAGGTYDVYLVFVEDGTSTNASLMNLNWLALTLNEPEFDEITDEHLKFYASSITNTGSNVETITFEIPLSGLGQSYQLQFSNTLEENSWTDTGDPQTGTRNALTFQTVAPIILGKRFYRVQVTLP
ncbi:MAG: carbohydrate-binding protein [Akkermansiaceae bacterium]